MPEQSEKNLEIENLEVSELEPEDLEDVAGAGDNYGCPCPIEIDGACE